MILNSIIGAINLRSFRASTLQKLYLFSTRHKNEVISQHNQTRKKKGFLSGMRKQLFKHSNNKSYNNPSHKDEQNVIKSFDPIQQINSKTRLANPQKFIFESEFHSKGIPDLAKTIQQIQALNKEIVSDEMKRQLTKSMRQITKQRQSFKQHGFGQQQFAEEYKKYQKKEQSFVQHYILLSVRISQTIEQILKNCESLNPQSFSTFSFVLSLIKRFNFLQFYTFFLVKLGDIQDESSIKQVTEEEVKFNFQIIETLSQMDYFFEKNTMPHNLQRCLNQFFQYKLQKIINHKTQLSLLQKISILTKIQKILSSTHLTYTKHYFYVQFLNQHIQELQRFIQTQKQITIENVDLAIDMFLLLANSLVLDEQLIKRFNTILINFCGNSLDMFQPSRTRKIIEIYSQIGRIPQAVYKKLVAKHLYNTFANNEYNFVQALKFYIYSDCEDYEFLDKFLSKFGKMINSPQLTSNKRSRHTLHFLVHFLCIKYPLLAEYQSSLKVLDFCQSHSQKDFKVVGEILKVFEEDRKVHQKNNREQNEGRFFLSPCIGKETNQIQNTHRSTQSELQEKILRENLSTVINELNQQKQGKEFYEIKKNFSFCTFEMDFTVLKWDSAKRQRLLSYLDMECVGLQYCYDSFEGNNQKKTAKILNSMSMVEYEKGLRMVRKKQVRESILRHYGWRMFYMPNKYLYYKLVDRRRLQEMLKETIEAKMS